MNIRQICRFILGSITLLQPRPMIMITGFDKIPIPKPKLNIKLVAMPIPKIKNDIYPSCVDCMHYEPTALGRCKMFGEKNIVTDETKYDFADTCREDEERCGVKGKYYIERNNVEYNRFMRSVKTQISKFKFEIFIIFFFILEVMVIVSGLAKKV